MVANSAACEKLKLDGFIFFPERLLANSSHVPAIKALGELVAWAMDTFERGPDGLFGTKQQNFSQMAEHWEGASNARDEEGPLVRKPME